jgi:hypothetical protein
MLLSVDVGQEEPTNKSDDVLSMMKNNDKMEVSDECLTHKSSARYGGYFFFML